MPYPCFAPPARLARISIDGSENRPKFNSFIGLSSPKNIGTTYISLDVTTSNVIYMQTSSSVKSFGCLLTSVVDKEKTAPPCIRQEVPPSFYTLYARFAGFQLTPEPAASRRPTVSICAAISSAFSARAAFASFRRLLNDVTGSSQRAIQVGCSTSMG